MQMGVREISIVDVIRIAFYAAGTVAVWASGHNDDARVPIFLMGDVHGT